MATTTIADVMTADEFYDFCHRPENRDRHFELERGKVVEMSRPGELHGVVCGNVTFLFGSYIRAHNRGRTCCNDTGVLWEEEPDTVRGPDVFLYEQSLPYERLAKKYSKDIPKLVVEVFSPNDSWPKMFRRAQKFLASGVAVVWIVSPDTRTVTVCHSGEFPQTLEENEDLTGAPPFPDLKCKVADLFFVAE